MSEEESNNLIESIIDDILALEDMEDYIISPCVHVSNEDMT